MQGKHLKGLLSFLLLTLLLAGGFVFWQYRISNILPRSEANGFAELPARVIIQKIGVDALVEQVALDEKGRMAIPSNYTDVGWYKLGPRPGAFGSAVLAAHLSTKTLEPAVFADLHKLEPGDDIWIMDEKGNGLRFKVRGSKTYDHEDTAALQEVFGDRDGVHLNLITCDGVWVQSAKSYSERLVVFADLAK
jgi:sortase A